MCNYHSYSTALLVHVLQDLVAYCLCQLAQAASLQHLRQPCQRSRPALPEGTAPVMQWSASAAVLRLCISAAAGLPLLLLLLQLLLPVQGCCQVLAQSANNRPIPSVSNQALLKWLTPQLPPVNGFGTHLLVHPFMYISIRRSITCPPPRRRHPAAHVPLPSPTRRPGACPASAAPCAPRWRPCTLPAQPGPRSPAAAAAGRAAREPPPRSSPPALQLRAGWRQAIPPA